MDEIGAQRWFDHYKFMQGVPEHGIMMTNLFGEMDPLHRILLRDGFAEKVSPPKKQDASCGTAACVVGWLAVSFPYDWCYVSNGLNHALRLIEGSSLGMWKDVERYFGMSPENAE